MVPDPGLRKAGSDAAPGRARSACPKGRLEPAVPEVEQETGRKGAMRVKRLLEGSMRFRLPYDAYQHHEKVSLPMLTGRVETYDLSGDHRAEDLEWRAEIFVESKNVGGAAGQDAEFKRFLAQAYSATAKRRDEIKTDPKFEFMWATTCPWKGNGFLEVASKDSILAAIDRHLDDEVIPKEHEIDASLVDLIPDRIWLWVIADRHEEMSPTNQMRGYVMQRLAEEGL
jgi:hypothetical protein